jgi:DNA-binding NtrC family response regulator
VRELENALERAVLVAQGVLLEARDLWPRDRRSPVLGTPTGFEGWQDGPPAALKRALEGPERWLILRALEQHGGNRSATAQALGINRTTLFNKMRRYALLSFPSRASEPPSPANGQRAAG